jgi:hypothetical protein
MVVTITWSPASTGDPATSFVLFYTVAQGGGGSVEISDTSLSATAPVAGEFSVYVCGQNAAGVGGCSATQTFQIGGAPAPAPTARPNPVTNLRVSVSGLIVTLTWDPLVGAMPDMTYTVLLSGPGYFLTLEAGPVFDRGTAVTTVSGSLNPGQFSVSMFAKNAAGNGDTSNQVQFTVSGAGCDVPGVPGQLTASVPRSPDGSPGNRVTIEWSAPSGGGTAPTGSGLTYVVVVSPGPLTSTVETFTTFTSFGELPAGRYTVTVRARNSCGLGDAASTTFTVGST